MSEAPNGVTADGRTIHSYKHSVPVGEFAEEVAEWHYRNDGFQVYRLATDPLYRVLDIDLAVENAGELTFVEVKGDTYRRRGGKLNIYLETMSNVGRSNPGWLAYSTADYLFYVFVHEGIALLVPLSSLRAWFDENRTAYEMKTVANGKGGKKLYESEGYAVPLDDVLNGIEEAALIEGLPTMLGR